jgi:monoterpene epsilon-lactone hydrolase
MASAGARAIRLVLRLTTKLPISRATGKPEMLRDYRRTIGRGVLLFGRLARGLSRVPVEDRAADTHGEWVICNDRPASPVVVYYLHGGGYVAGSPAMYRTLTGALALRCRARVFALEYRLAPEHRFPAALDDAVSGYRWLLAQGVDPRQIVVAGDSAGGGLTLSTLLALRDRGLAMPAGGVLIGPWVDLAATGQSHRSNAQSDDVVVSDGGKNLLARAYLGDRPLDDPGASGLYADLHGLPPLLSQASSIEMLRDDAVRLDAKARAAGVDSTLRLFDGVPHVWHLFSRLPESREALGDIAAFVERVTSSDVGARKQ